MSLSSARRDLYVCPVTGGYLNEKHFGVAFEFEDFKARISQVIIPQNGLNNNVHSAHMISFARQIGGSAQCD